MNHFRLNTLFDTLEEMEKSFQDIELEAEEVGIEHALGRYAAEDIAVRDDIPGFNRAAVDGYAVISGDTYGTGDGVRPVFSQMGQSDVGKECTISLGPNECVYISAGAMMPPNADAVVTLDDSEVIGPLEIVINRTVNRGESVIHKGDDFKKGAILLSKGNRIGTREIGALAGAGHSHIKVLKRLHASVVSTGDEIIEPFNTILSPGQVRDINSYTISANLKTLGVVPANKGIVKDNSRGMEEVLEKSLNSSDIIIITGGSSEGTMDKTLSVIKRIEGVEIIINKIGMSPGADSIVARVGNRVIFCLPGNPISALITFNIMVKPMIMCFNKSAGRYLSIRAKCTRSYKSAPGREEYLIINIDRNEDIYTATPMIGKEGFITSMLSADGYVKIRASDDGIKEGQEVEVILF